MKVSTKTDYYEEDEIQKTEELIESASELIDLIEQKLENRPSKGKLFNIWRNETNHLIEDYNERFGKVYTRV